MGTKSVQGSSDANLVLAKGEGLRAHHDHDIQGNAQGRKNKYLIMKVLYGFAPFQRMHRRNKKGFRFYRRNPCISKILLTDASNRP